MATAEKTCNICGAACRPGGLPLLCCSGCRQVFYCGEAHQKQGWCSHKHGCRHIRKRLHASTEVSKQDTRKAFVSHTRPLSKEQQTDLDQYVDMHLRVLACVPEEHARERNRERAVVRTYLLDHTCPSENAVKRWFRRGAGRCKERAALKALEEEEQQRRSGRRAWSKLRSHVVKVGKAKGFLAGITKKAKAAEPCEQPDVSPDHSRRFRFSSIFKLVDAEALASQLQGEEDGDCTPGDERKLRRIFSSLDSDHDGQLSESELILACQQAHQVSEVFPMLAQTFGGQADFSAERSRLLGDKDVDDILVSWNEFRNFYLNREPILERLCGLQRVNVDVALDARSTKAFPRDPGTGDM